jgi:alpha/beta superfamily hydrolase
MEAIPYLPTLMSENIALFAMDFAGSGRSEGTYISLGLSEQNDLDYAIKYLDEMFNFQEYFLWGRSMGAVTALLYQSNCKHHKARSSKVHLRF